MSTDSNSLTGRQRKISPCHGRHVEIGCVTFKENLNKVFSKTHIRNSVRDIFPGARFRSFLNILNSKLNHYFT